MALAGIDRRRDVPVSKWRGMELRQREDRTKFSTIECTTCDDVSSRLFGGRGRGFFGARYKKHGEGRRADR